MKKKHQGGVMIGKILLHYRMLEKLGEGGMGVVYKAEDTRLKRLVAVKFLPRDIAGSDEVRERFAVEAQAAAALNHPNIATIYTIEEADDVLFIVMEYVHGRQLKEIISERDDEPLSIDQITEYALQIAEGLHEAHEKGVVHRDVKSANILLTNGGQIKILDFGVAKIRDSMHVIKDGSLSGTLAYMSPEQIRGENVDHRTDIWAFGVVLYEMFTRQLPFKGYYPQEIQYSILNEDVESLVEVNSETPRELAEIVNKALQKDSQDRYQNMKAVIVDLMFLRLQSKQKTSTKERRRSRITILPFTNVRDAPENGALGNGPAKELVNSPSNGKHSVTFPSGIEKTRVRETGRRLNFNVVQDGRMGKLSRLLRLIVQLVNVVMATVYRAFNSQ